MEQFKKEPYKNPVTVAQVEIGSKEYENLVKKYGQPYKIKSPKTGRKINIGRGEYTKLKNDGYTDEQLLNITNFKTLPPELQSIILSENVDVLEKTPILTREMIKIVKQPYLSEICTKPISKKEIELYVNKYMPEHIYYFSHENIRILHLTAMKFTLKDVNLPEYTYSVSWELVEEEENILTYQIIGGDDQDTNVLKQGDSLVKYAIDLELDLLTQYHIYRDRNCDKLKINFSRNLILNHLVNKYKTLYELNYKSLLILYVYLKVNLLYFPVKIPKGLYLNVVVTIDNNNDIINIEDNLITPENLLLAIKNDVDYLYKELTKQINMLD